MSYVENAKKLRTTLDNAGAMLTDEQALTVVSMYPLWKSGVTYIVGDRIQYNGVLYKCVQAHTSELDWSPDVTPALWVAVNVEEWPEWKQPSGAHDAYNKGDKVTYNGKHYICMLDDNVYAPDIAGWEEQTE